MTLSSARIRKLRAQAEQADAKALEQKSKVKGVVGKVKEKVADVQIAVEEKFEQVKHAM